MTGTTRFLPTYPTIPHMQCYSRISVRRLPTRTCNSLFFNRIPEFFDHWISEDFARNPANFGFCRGFVEPAIERQFEKFPLAHILQSLIAQLVERSLDGFALRIQDAPLQRNVYVCFHGDV